MCEQNKIEKFWRQKGNRTKRLAATWGSCCRRRNWWSTWTESVFNLITTSLWSVPRRFCGDGGIADLEILNIWLLGLLLLGYGLQHVMQAFWCSLFSDIWNRAKTNWPVCLIRGRIRWPDVKSHGLKRNLRGICKHVKGPLVMRRDGYYCYCYYSQTHQTASLALIPSVQISIWAPNPHACVS